MPHIERLKQLADHLLHGQLIHREFDFNYYNIDVHSPDNLCGTSGCAIGECPGVWPDKWEFDKRTFDPVLIGGPSTPRQSGQLFFDLIDTEYSALFLSHNQHLKDLPFLGEDATKEQVANNILEFCKRFEQ